MEINQNRLRFVHCEHLFNDINEIKHYVRSVQNLRASLYAEPMIFKYGNEKTPSIVLAIGSVGNGKFEFDPEEGTVLNETFYIDFSQVEKDIENLYKEVGKDTNEIERISGILKNIINSCGFNESGEYVKDAEDLILKNANSIKEADKLLSDYIISLEKRQELYANETSTFKPTIEKNEEGTTFSGDVKLGTKILDGKVIDNNIEIRENGIFTNVDLDYFENDSKLVLTINGEDKKDIKIPSEYHIISGFYDNKKEKIVLKLNKEKEIDGVLKDTIDINVSDLIDEWTVMGDLSETPIVLKKEHISSKELVHDGHYEWQDVLKADVRIVDNETMPYNILSKSSDGKKLYVDGRASNISYIDGNKKTNVQEELENKISKDNFSKNPENVITYRTDGLYSMVDFSYNEGTNEITFKRTNPNGEIIEKICKLNSLSFLEDVTYDSSHEEIVIVYKNANGEMKTLRIPMQIVVDAFGVDNSDTTVTLTLDNIAPGQNKLKADVNISLNEDNILQDVGHALYVRGSADNISVINKKNGNNVEEALNNISYKLDSSISDADDKIDSASKDIEEKLNLEIARAKDEELRLDKKIELEENRSKGVEEELGRNIKEESRVSRENEKTNSEAISAERNRAVEVENKLSAKLNNEIERSSNKDSLIEGNITKEILRAKEAERLISDSVSDEYNRAILVEKDLTDKLSQETSRSKEKDSELLGLLNNEKTRAEGVENNISDKLSKEISRADKVEKELNDKIVSEEKRAINSENKLSTSILEEKTRAEGIEKALSNSIDREVDRAVKTEAQLRLDLSGEITRATDKENSINEKLNGEINKTEEYNKQIRASIADLERNTNLETENTGTLTLNKVDREKGFVINGKVNVSSKVNNLLNTDGEPLFASVDLTYDAAKNQLTFSRSGIDIKEIKLNEGSLINDIRYDGNTKELIITYEDANGAKREVKVSVSELFNQWEVEDNHLGGIILTKTINFNGKGTDKLKAEVVVSDLPSNALVNDKGSLYVSNQAKDVKMSNPEKYGENVDAAISNVDTKISELKNQFDNYYDENLINSMNKDIANLKNKTNINEVDSPSVNLTFTSTENSSSLKADVILSKDPHNLLKISNDGLDNIDGSYNGVLFDGNIDYKYFSNKDSQSENKYSDYTRHLQEKRNEGLFNTRNEANEFMTSEEFLSDKKDGELLLGRYKNGLSNSFILGFVREYENGQKELQTIENDIYDCGEYEGEDFLK